MFHKNKYNQNYTSNQNNLSNPNYQTNSNNSTNNIEYEFYKPKYVLTTYIRPDGTIVTEYI
jgi:hypothetical protein